MEVVVTKKNKLASIKINHEELASFITDYKIDVEKEKTSLTVTFDLSANDCSLKLSCD